VTSAPLRLFLFDVDGTLVTARGAGRTALAEALERTFGTMGAIDRYDFRGKTDPRIVVDLMQEAGVPDAVIRGRLPACFDAYVAALDRLIGDGHRVDVMPGVDALVEALSAREDAVVGLLTGNIEAGARIKLRPTGLLPRFRVGAFGSDDPDRRRLPAIARARARALAGRVVPFEQVTIIGDTPLDVDCARACGAVAVAVATGQHPADELEACAPDLLFADFSDVDAAVRALAGA
jgi:phosphoglycolate phosphatase-like HAD superfamily hydrolase